VGSEAPNTKAVALSEVYYGAGRGGVPNTKAAAPSEMVEALPAVTVAATPVGAVKPAGRSLACEWVCGCAGGCASGCGKGRVTAHQRGK
jgi:hypothetical protein